MADIERYVLKRDYDEDDIVWQYVHDGKSLRFIADKHECSRGTITKVLINNGVPIRNRGNNLGRNWKGGKFTTDEGYVWLHKNLIDPQYQPMLFGNYASEHRIIMAQYLGRVLRKSETVHHIDGNRSNNDITNLQLRNKAHGEGQILCCAECGSINLVAEEI